MAKLEEERLELYRLEAAGAPRVLAAAAPRPAVLLPSFPISGVPPFDKTAASAVSEEVRTPEGVGWGGGLVVFPLFFHRGPRQA